MYLLSHLYHYFYVPITALHICWIALFTCLRLHFINKLFWQDVMKVCSQRHVFVFFIWYFTILSIYIMVFWCCLWRRKVWYKDWKCNVSRLKKYIPAQSHMHICTFLSVSWFYTIEIFSNDIVSPSKTPIRLIADKPCKIMLHCCYQACRRVQNFQLTKQKILWGISQNKLRSVHWNVYFLKSSLSTGMVTQSWAVKITNHLEIFVICTIFETFLPIASPCWPRCDPVGSLCRAFQILN